jgi:hypothetical protein
MVDNFMNIRDIMVKDMNWMHLVMDLSNKISSKLLKYHINYSLFKKYSAPRSDYSFLYGLVRSTLP